MRKSMGRRVSFAPDAELEVTHLFSAVSDYHLSAFAILETHEGLHLTGKLPYPNVQPLASPDQNVNPNSARAGLLSHPAQKMQQRESFPPVLEDQSQSSPGNSTMDLTGTAPLPPAAPSVPHAPASAASSPKAGASFFLRGAPPDRTDCPLGSVSNLALLWTLHRKPQLKCIATHCELPDQAKRD